MKKILRVFLVSLAFLATSFCIYSPASALTYAFTDLGAGSVANAINESGQVVGSVTTDGALHAALWNGTSLTDLGVGEARDINNAGQVIGNSNGQATLWNGTARTDMGSFRAIAINNTGLVAGDAGNGPNAVVWDGAIRMLESPNTATMVVADMNDAGLISGWGRGGTAGPSFNSPRLLDSETGEATHLFSGANAFFPDGAAAALNGTGTAVGEAYVGKEIHALLWDNSPTPVDLGTLEGEHDSQAYGINDTGQIVGSSAPTHGAIGRAVLWEGGSIFDLNSFLDASTIAAGWKLASAADINESGWIVGQAFNTLTQESRGYVLAPVPEPEIYATLVAGMIVVGWNVRRKKGKEAANCRCKAA